MDDIETSKEKQPGMRMSLERVPSYNNRYRSPSVECASLPSVNEEAGTPLEKKLQLERRASAASRRAEFMRLTSQTRTSTDSVTSPTFNSSVDSTTDDVFVDVTAGDGAAPCRRLEQTLSASSTASSTMPILPNPHNVINHSIHDCFWCCGCFFFAFFCCLPAIRFMESSDLAFARGEDEKARRYGRLSTGMFVAGALLTILLISGIFFLVIYFTAFN